MQKSASKSRLEASRRRLGASCGVSLRLVASRRVVSWRLVASRGVSWRHGANQSSADAVEGVHPTCKGESTMETPPHVSYCLGCRLHVACCMCDVCAASCLVVNLDVDVFCSCEFNWTCRVLYVMCRVLRMVCCCLSFDWRRFLFFYEVPFEFYVFFASPGSQFSLLFGPKSCLGTPRGTSEPPWASIWRYLFEPPAQNEHLGRS